jgi:hypothetical protein
MLQLGRKIYYRLSDGLFLCDTGECSGDVHETTKSQDMKDLPVLQGYTDDQVDFIHLDYGARADEFANFGSMHVDITQTPPTLIITPRPVTAENTADTTTDSTTSAS